MAHVPDQCRMKTATALTKAMIRVRPAPCSTVTWAGIQLPTPPGRQTWVKEPLAPTARQSATN